MSGPFIDQVDQDQGGKILRIFRSIFVREEFDGAGTDNDVEQYIPRLLSGLNFPSIKQQTCKKLQSLDGATIFSRLALISALVLFSCCWLPPPAR